MHYSCIKHEHFSRWITYLILLKEQEETAVKRVRSRGGFGILALDSGNTMKSKSWVPALSQREKWLLEMTGLPFCRGCAIISNDWWEHKLSHVFVLCFAFHYQKALLSSKDLQLLGGKSPLFWLFLCNPSLLLHLFVFFPAWCKFLL